METTNLLEKRKWYSKKKKKKKKRKKRLYKFVKLYNYFYRCIFYYCDRVRSKRNPRSIIVQYISRVLQAHSDIYINDNWAHGTIQHDTTYHVIAESKYRMCTRPCYIRCFIHIRIHWRYLLVVL
ncbi:hypothetical protein PUN28_019284 [Cardiocondyla obscurior]|uniref:Ribosomal protein S17 n=1 Tax=Cardiocondyla obscurior TaxID=286306 RepID=A0AAW2EG83_9HYME